MKESPNPSGLTGNLERLRHWISPWKFPDPKEEAEILELYRRDDAEENERATPSKEEKVKVHCLWMVEVYPPSHFSSLESGIQRLGWNNRVGGQPNEVGLWLREGRSRAYRGNWLNLGTVLRPGDGRFLGVDRRAPLPEGVGYADATVINVSPSATCLILQFVLEDDASEAIDGILRTEYRTTLERMKWKGHRIHSPLFRKRDAVRDWMRTLHDSCTSWFRSNFPGSFSTGLLKGNFPTCWFLTLRESAPFPRDEDERPPAWLDPLGIGGDFQACHTDQFLGLGLTPPIFEDRLPETLFLTGKEDEILNETDLDAYGGRSKHGFTNFLSRRMYRLLALWALSRLLLGYEASLSEVRDNALTRKAKRITSVMKDINDLQSSTLRFSGDIESVCAELEELAADPKNLEYDTLDFVPMRPEIWKGNPFFSHLLAEDILLHAKWIQRMEGGLRELLVTRSSLLSLSANLRVQRAIVILTIVLVALGLVTVWLSYLFFRQGAL